MTLPAGTISLSEVNVELGLSATAQISLNDAAVRTLAGVASGAIGMTDLQGKSNVFAFTISSNQVDANLRSLAISAGWNGTSAVQATVNADVWISGSVAANSTAAITINGSFPAGVTLINNGTIAGRGGNGGAGATEPGFAGAGTAGGCALLASVGVTIQNNGTIAGGGGGGGGGGFNLVSSTCSMGEDDCRVEPGGGGGGGGRSNASYTASGGAAGASSYSASGTCSSGAIAASAGGTGTSSAAGGGGAAAKSPNSCRCPNCENVYGGAGGAGGAWGTAGTTGAATPDRVGGAGGAAGQAVSGNSNITWTAFGTRSGPIV